ncbi:DVU_1556 family methyltransferase [Desulforamulus ferrireducens]|uniref:SAM-dependent methyltransferase n=1 Tax=Desulforamulus ferrireducens TaxID=1833852 RepID=A0A1S6ITK6_9FIRM|nr:methyltransferase domain-containing protein [Desulforamulus ferrireducens]AQS58106.1 SAM-dependent methyltransferase [Desulforamulus ferrireducens]
MSNSGGYCIYEGTAIRQVTGDSIRPGGFQLTERAMEFCALPPGAKVLDIGCGTGATVEYLIDKYQLQAVGIDPSHLLLAQGRQRRPDLPIFQAVGECLPFYEGEMAGVLAECSLSVMTNPARVLRECQRVLRAGGYLILTDIYAKNSAAVAGLRTLPLVSCVTGAMGRQELEEMLKQAGLRVVLWEDHGELLKQLMVRLILTHGSLKNFWQQGDTGGMTGESIQEIIKEAKLSYYLLVAQKGEDK